MKLNISDSASGSPRIHSWEDVTTRAVLKIGGGILRNKKDLEMLVKILRMNSERENILVVSALYGVTDMLLNAYTEGKNISRELRKIHCDYFDIKNKEFETALQELSKILSRKRKNFKRKEMIACFGERLSAILISEYLNSNGIPALAMNSEQCGIVSDKRFENANCLLEKTIKNFSKNIIPKISGKTLVITGFYGVDENGNVNTFGRGGSDYSAAVVAVATNAQVLEIWKDVEGFMTADPRIMKNARKLEEISFTEAKELGYAGAKILHPRTFDVLKDSPIFVEIKSVLKLECSGTRIVKKKTIKSNKIVTALSAKKGMTLINISGGNMVDVPGVAAQIFAEVAKTGISIDTIATSQVCISFTINDENAELIKKTLEKLKKTALKFKYCYEIKRSLAAISVVGEGMIGTPGVAARIFSAVAKKGINIDVISQAATEINVSFMVEQKNMNECICAIHEEFELGEP